MATGLDLARWLGQGRRGRLLTWCGYFDHVSGGAGRVLHCRHEEVCSRGADDAGVRRAGVREDAQASQAAAQECAAFLYEAQGGEASDGRASETQSQGPGLIFPADFGGKGGLTGLNIVGHGEGHLDACQALRFHARFVA